MKFIIVAFIIVLLISSQTTYGFANTDTWRSYAAYTEVFENGLLVKTNLELRSSEKNFLANNFQRYIVTGSSTTDNKLPLEAVAKHHAIMLLLINNGLKSIKSRRTIVNTDYSDKVTMTYVGVVEFPIKIISYKYTQGNNTLECVFEINFSPVAFPTAWPYLKLKNRVLGFVKNFIDILY
jgi:hypothetical protein